MKTSKEKALLEALKEHDIEGVTKIFAEQMGVPPENVKVLAAVHIRLGPGRDNSHDQSLTE